MVFVLGLSIGIAAFYLINTIIAKRNLLKKLKDETYPIKKFNKNTHHYLVVANGPFLPKKIILEAAQDKHIIALDGAADRLAALGIMPDFILGDFDSIQNLNYWGIKQAFFDIKINSEPYMGNYEIKIVPAKNQNLTDLQKSIKFCHEQKAESIHIACAIGDRVDHTLCNLRTLRTEYIPQIPIYLHTETQTLRYINNEEYEIQGVKGDFCGVMSFPQGILSSDGLEYDVKNFPLNFGYSESVCNQLSTNIAKITLAGEALIIMPGILSSQGEFNKKTRTERIHLLIKESERETALVSLNALKSAFPDSYPEFQPDESNKVLISVPTQDSVKQIFGFQNESRVKRLIYWLLYFMR